MILTCSLTHTHSHTPLQRGWTFSSRPQHSEPKCGYIWSLFTIIFLLKTTPPPTTSNLHGPKSMAQSNTSDTSMTYLDQQCKSRAHCWKEKTSWPTHGPRSLIKAVSTKHQERTSIKAKFWDTTVYRQLIRILLHCAYIISWSNTI